MKQSWEVGPTEFGNLPHLMTRQQVQELQSSPGLPIHRVWGWWNKCWWFDRANGWKEAVEALQVRELQIRERPRWQPLLVLCSAGRRAEQVGDQAESRLEADW